MRIVFIGTGEIGVPTMRRLQQSTEFELVAVVTQADKPVGRDQVIMPPPIKKALEGSKLPILQPVRIKDQSAIDEIRAFQPDVIVVMAYGQILTHGVLESPRLACLNLHASLLPRWRGAAPIQAAIAAGDRETGITVMYMDEGLDTGDILLQRKIDIAPNETGDSLHDRLAAVAPDALIESLSMLASGNVPRIPQDKSLVTTAPKLNREHGRIDWSEPADAIERKVRAFNPWPGAFMQLAGGKLKIFSATIFDLHGEPGEIARHGSEFVVFARDRALLLNEVQAEGRRRMTGSDFIRGRRE